MAAPAVMGPIGAWLAGDQAAIAATTDTIPGNLAVEVVKLVSQAAAGRCTAATSSQLSSLALADGVLKMFMLKKLSIVAAVIVSLATLTVGGGVAFVRTSQAQDAKSEVPSTDTETKRTCWKLPTNRPSRSIAQQLFQQQRCARRGAIRIPASSSTRAGRSRSTDSSRSVINSERWSSRRRKAALQREIVKRRVLKRLEGVERARQDKQLTLGSAPAGDLADIRLRRMQAEIDLKTPDNEQADLPAILKRLKELERKVEQLEKRVPASLGGRM